jgi:superoxide reductase
MRFGDILKGAEAEGKEKHVPIIEIDKGRREDVDIVRVVVGKDVPHPNTVEHHIVWIEIYGVKKDGQVVDLGRVAFAPTYTNPNARFQVQVPVEEFKSFCALSYCNIHGVWQNCIEVEQK